MTNHELFARIAALFSAQRLAALATQGGGQPHVSLVAYAATPDLRGIVFVTPRDTRKYANLIAEPRVSMLIDNRQANEAGFDGSIAVTATGAAQELHGDERADSAALYLARHPHLTELAHSHNSAIIRVRITQYRVVTTITDVVDMNV